jgi:hypothetical protein
MSESEWLNEEASFDLLKRIFPRGLQSTDLLTALCPQGWQNSSLKPLLEGGSETDQQENFESYDPSASFAAEQKEQAIRAAGCQGIRNNEDQTLTDSSLCFLC